ncbi:hypothetical protein EXIGLDRAFT_842606 [Exidia glandulosa HHB12029]|uniref:Uncharacterized protein n=1 Tax=Exidia glandulosa HHB12029 TaxID=1314781 RepID=A0A165D6M1_EXIGL|nr:hypothetical protein EXIGLDRAFT_842606 [Exidia glandulosa HHB12029]
MSTPPTLAAMLARQFDGQVSPLRLLCDSVQDALAALEGDQDTLDDLRQLLQRCNRLKDALPQRETPLVAPERAAFNTIAAILTEATTAPAESTGALSGLRRRFGPERHREYDNISRIARVRNWRKRVEDALYLRDIEADIVMQNLGFSATGLSITPRPARTEAQVSETDTGTPAGEAVDAMLVLYERLLGYAESSSGQLQVLAGNHTEVLRAAEMSERERET